MTIALDTPLSDVVAFEDYRRASELIAELVSEIGPTEWSNLTPNSEWDVHDLVHHVTEEHVWAEQLIAGVSLERAESIVQSRMQAADLSTLFSEALEDVAAAASLTAANDLVETSYGFIMATSFLHELMADQLIHAWDLAKGLGRDIVLPVDLVDKVATWFAEHENEWRAAGAIGPQVAVDSYASPQTRLLAAFGRDTGWR